MCPLPLPADEIVGARDWLVKECGIPQEDVVGFRAPYLIHNSYIREVSKEKAYYIFLCVFCACHLVWCASGSCALAATPTAG